MFFHFDAEKFVLHQLPPVLRKESIYAFLKVLVFPIKQLAEAFKSYKLTVDRELTYNSFTDYLERFLNGLFFFEDGIIFITETENKQTSLSFEYETAPTNYMSFQTESPATALMLKSISPNEITGSFQVNVPSVLSEADRDLVYDWVNFYKMAGTEFTIVVYE